MTPARPEIWRFEDYRLFLKSMFAYSKAKNPKVSYQYCARRLRTTTSYLKHVHSRKRNISLEKITPLAEFYGLAPYERHYLLLLFLRSSTRDAATKKYFTDALNVLKGQAFNLKPYLERPLSSSDQSDALRDSVASVIMQIAKYPGARCDPKWIQEQFVARIPLERIHGALETLIQKKIVRCEEGHLKLIEEVHAAPNPLDPDSFQIYRVGLARAHEILEDAKKYKPCSFLMGDFAVDEATAERIFQAFGELTSSIVKWAESTSLPTRVITLSNCIYTSSTYSPETS